MRIHEILWCFIYVFILSLLSINVSKSQGLELVGSCELTGYPLPQYIVVNGNYAYIGGHAPLLQIADISDPENPYVLGLYDTAGTTWDLCVTKNHVFIAGSTCLFIIDVSNPANPALVSSYYISTVAHDIEVRYNIAYLLACHKFYTLNISNLAEPELLSEFVLYIADADRMLIRNNYAYIESYVGGSYAGIRIVSIDNPSNPILVGSFTDMHAGYDIALVHNYAYIPYRDGIQIIDIADPSNPYSAGEYDSTHFAREIYVDGNYAFLAENDWSGEGGIRILDISQSLEPQFILSYNEHPYNDVFYLNGLIYATRSPRRLDIFRFSMPTDIDNQNNPPTALRYLASFPNPFNSSTTISFTLNERGTATLSVYSIQGQRIAELSRGIREAGEHSISWDASEYPSGVYFARLEARGASKTAKMVLLK